MLKSLYFNQFFLFVRYSFIQLFSRPRDPILFYSFLCLNSAYLYNPNCKFSDASSYYPVFKVQKGKLWSSARKDVHADQTSMVYMLKAFSMFGAHFALCVGLRFTTLLHVSDLYVTSCKLVLLSISTFTALYF